MENLNGFAITNKAYWGWAIFSFLAYNYLKLIDHNYHNYCTHAYLHVLTAKTLATLS